MKDSEGEALRQLLGDDRKLINLTYTLHPVPGRAATAPRAGRIFGDPPASLPNVLNYYRSTQPRRLVITGAAGAGKTVLSLELLLTLTQDRSPNSPVPVRVALAQWDTNQPLTTLLTQRLIEDYDWPPDAAADLVDHDLVLPVLDGLDEMDPLRADGTPDPDAPRARAVLEKLNAYYQDGRDAGPLILTCRTAHYDAFDLTTRLVDAARITIDPVRTDQAIAYLCARTPDPSRWRPLVEHLRARSRSPLATILSTPWRLCLTATVYYRDGNPAELLNYHTEADLDEHLLAHYIRAATAVTDNPHGYRPDDVHRWLHHLTGHLGGATAGTASTDIALQRLWTLAGKTRVRIADILLTALITIPTLSLALAVALASIIDGPGPGDGTSLPIQFTAFASLLCYRPTPEPGRLRMSIRTFSNGFPTRFWSGFRAWFALGFLIGLIPGIPGLVFNFFVDSQPVTMEVIVGALRVCLALGVVVGVIGGFMSGMGQAFRTRFKTWFWRWLVIGFAFGFVAWSTDNFYTLIVGGSYQVTSTGGGHWSATHFPGGHVFAFPHSLLNVLDLLSQGIFFGLIGGLAGGLMGGLVRGLRGEPTTLAKPRAIIRDDMVYAVVIGPIVGIVAGIFGALVRVFFYLDNWMSGLMIGLAIALMVMLVTGLAGTARRYWVFLLCSRGKLPFRLAPFLEWSVGAGFLRYNGPSYQFRHRELEQWLAQRAHP